MPAQDGELNPEHIPQVGLGFWPAQALLTAVEQGVFTLLAKEPATGEQIRVALGWHPRGVHDLLDGLVALHLLDRDGGGPSARYRNTPDTGAFLDKGSRSYLGGILEMAHARLYPFWGGLSEAM